MSWTHSCSAESSLVLLFTFPLILSTTPSCQSASPPSPDRSQRALLQPPVSKDTQPTSFPYHFTTTSPFWHLCATRGPLCDRMSHEASTASRHIARHRCVPERHLIASSKWQYVGIQALVLLAAASHAFTGEDIVVRWYLAFQAGLLHLLYLIDSPAMLLWYETYANGSAFSASSGIAYF